MGATYTRQSASAIVDGGVIEASDINAEFNQVLAAFAVTSGHTHDGTAAEGGPITKLLGTALTIGDGTAGTDIAVTFDGETADGVLTWMEDEDYFKFSDDILMNSTERLNFGDTGTYIFQSTDGQLDIVADTEVQIAATTIDINGAVDISGALTLAGTTLAETISDTVGAMVTSNTESGITVAYDDADNTLDFTVGTLNQDTTGNAATATILETARTIGGTSFNGSANIAVALSATATALATARTIHGVSFDGTANIDLSEVISDTVGAMVTSNTESGITVAYDDADNTLDFTVGTLNQNTTGTAATVTTAAQPNVTSLGTLTTLTVDNVIINGSTIGHTGDTDLITVASGIATVAGEVSMTTLDIGGTNVTATAAELNLIDGGATVGTTAIADGDGIIHNDGTTMRVTSAATFKTYFTAGVSSAADDLTAGDAAVNVTTSSGDITIDSNAGAVSIDGHTGVTLASSNSGNITLDSVADIILDSAGNDFNFKAGGTEVLRITNSSSDVIIRPVVDAKDLIFQQRDGTEVARIEDNATFNVVTGKLAINGTAITSTAAELNLLDGVSGLVQADLTKLAAVDSTAAELNTLDALSRGSLLYGNASAATTILTKGTANQVLTSDGTDIAWQDAGGGTNTPNFFARSSADQSLSAGSWTKVTFGTEDYDSDSAFASSKFTVPSGEGGKYFLHTSVFVGASSETSLSQQFTAFYKNGSIFRTDVSDFRGVRTHQYTATVSAILDLSATDYIEVYVQSSATSTLTLDSSAGKGVERLTTFQGFKLIT
jgi:hypothetical protein